MLRIVEGADKSEILSAQSAFVLSLASPLEFGVNSIRYHASTVSTSAIRVDHMTRTTTVRLA